MQLYAWIASFLIGLSMGIIAFVMDYFVYKLVFWKFSIVELIIHNYGLAWFAYTGMSMFLMLLGSLMTAYLGITALGSGVAEAMGFLNGVIFPDFIEIRTLIVKFCGVVLAVSAGICGGKEGPLVHIGSIVGILIIYIPIDIFKYFRNDTEKRKFMSMGLAAGVAAAFGAPIGGSLFAYELSKPNTFFTFSLTWRVFFACSISTFSLNIFKSLQNGTGITILSAGLIKLGSDNDPADLAELPAAIIFGVIGGLLGATFIYLNNKYNLVRKYHLKQKWMKVLESQALIVVTSIFVFFAPYGFRGDCRPVES